MSRRLESKDAGSSTEKRREIGRGGRSASLARRRARRPSLASHRKTDGHAGQPGLESQAATFREQRVSAAVMIRPGGIARSFPGIFCSMTRTSR